MTPHGMGQRRLRTELADCSLLIVDDSPTCLALLNASLRHAGFSRVLAAPDGQRAIDLVRRTPPDLLLLDLLMPGLDGFHVCAALRQDVAFDDLPILSMTALEDADERARAFAAGATDLIMKPIHQAELIARTTTLLEKRLLIRGLRAFRARTGAELATAREMQCALLPGPGTIRRIAERHGIAVAAICTPSAELGGDLWGIWSIDAGRIGVYALDVSGHGTIAAINAFRLHILLEHEELDRTDPGQFVAGFNERVTGLLPPGQFATMLYAVLDTERDLMTYAAAGSPAPVLLPPGGAPRALDGSGVPLGIERQVAYPTRQATFAKGARLLLHSDALPEARLPGGALIGEAATQAMVAAALRQEDPAAVVAELAGQLGSGLDDDLTLICLAR